MSILFFAMGMVLSVVFNFASLIDKIPTDKYQSATISSIWFFILAVTVRYLFGM